MAPAYEQGRPALPRQSRINVDETGHPEFVRSPWAWGFHAPGPHGLTWYRIDAVCNSEVLFEFLGEAFYGVVHCDCRRTRSKFLGETLAVVQFFWTHLIRDAKYRATLSEPVTQRWGERLLAPIKQLFCSWCQRERMLAENWQCVADRARRAVLEAARRSGATP